MLTQILHTANQRNKYPRRSYKFPGLYKSTPPSLLSPFHLPPPPLSPFLPPPPATPLHFKEVTNVNELQLLPVNIAPPLCSRKANLLAKYLPSLEVCYESRFKWYQSTLKYLKFSVCWPHCRDRARERERAGQQIGVNERMERPVYWPGPLSIVAAKSIFLFLVNICALSLRAGFKCQNRKITRAQTGKAL